MPTQHRILSLVYNEFEALDLFGPLGAIVPRSDYYSLELVNLHNLDSPSGVESSIKNGVHVIPTMALPMPSKETSMSDPILLQQIGQLVDRAANVFTVCSGSALLAATGRLNGRKATTNKRLYDQLTSNYPSVQWQKRARWVQDGKYLTSSGITAGIDAGFSFLTNTYVAPEDRQAHPEAQEVSVQGDATPIPGFNKEKALEFANSVAFDLEYRWHSDPADDPFVDLPSASGAAK